jgi:hypothetical protein
VLEELQLPNALSQLGPAAIVKRSLLGDGWDRRTIDRLECNALDTKDGHARSYVVGPSTVPIATVSGRVLAAILSSSWR